MPCYLSNAAIKYRQITNNYSINITGMIDLLRSSTVLLLLIGTAIATVVPSHLLNNCKNLPLGYPTSTEWRKKGPQKKHSVWKELRGHKCGGIEWPTAYLVGGWTNHLSKICSLRKWVHLPQIRGENKTYLKPPPRYSIHCSTRRWGKFPNVHQRQQQKSAGCRPS